MSSDVGVWPLAGIGDDYETTYYMDNEISLLLKHNDPNITSVIIDFKGIRDINSAGIHLDNNTHLRELEIEELPYTSNDGFENFNTKFYNFLSAVARSRSIEKLYIPHVNERHTGVSPLEVIESLSLLFSANLRDIEFEFFITEREAELLASTLSNSTNKRLTKISFHLFRVSDETAANIYTALADYELTKLHVRGNVGRRKSYTAISKLLKSPTTLKKLMLFHVHVQPNDECIEILSNALISNSTLECLNLEDTTITKDGMLLLAKALQMNPQSALREIDISGFSLKDDEDTAQVMANALACIPGLKTINLNTLTPFIDIIQRPNTSLENFYMYNDDRSGADLGSSLGSALANNTTLKTISLQQGRFSTESANVLGESLYSNNTLKYLDLGCTEAIDWGPIFPALSNPESSLEVLRLQEAGVKDDDLSLLATAVATNSLKELYLDGNDMISKDRWLDFFSRLQSNTLEKLVLNHNNIDDQVVSSIVSALRSKCPSLKKLELECYEITLVGWMALSTLLTCPTLNLEYLVIGGCRSRDDDGVLITFANALENNTSLKILHMPTNSVTERGWDALSNVLCNKTTIDATSSSNHTLEIISQDYCHYERRLPKDIRSLVRFNRAEDTVRRKIIRSHFSNNGMQLFIDDNDIGAGVMPHILAWVGRDFFGHDLLFRTVKSMPSLFG